jgi:hypothetical protein
MADVKGGDPSSLDNALCLLVSGWNNFGKQQSASYAAPRNFQHYENFFRYSILNLNESN